MNVLVDTNVILDVLLERHPFYDNSFLFFQLVDQKDIRGYVSAVSITDMFYIVQKQQGKNAARNAVKQLLQVFYPATVTDRNIYCAVELEWDDFEDSVQYTLREGLSVDYIITRNSKDFSSGSIEALTPEQFIQAIAGIED
jgi:predicted nucleic acid-binding protein